MHFVRKNVILRRLRALGKFRRRCRRPRRRHHHHHHHHHHHYHHHYTTTATVIIMVTNVHAFYAYCLWATVLFPLCRHLLHSLIHITGLFFVLETKLFHDEYTVQLLEMV